MRKTGAKRKPIDPWACVTRRMPLAEDQQTDIGNAYRLSLQAIMRGYGTQQTAATLACSMNAALILCEQGFAAGRIEDIKRAQAALLSCSARAEKFGKWGFTGDEVRAVMAACNIHDQQLTQATRGQVEAALREVRRRVEAGEYSLGGVSGETGG